ncbi:MAG: hypothetical protein KGN02_04345 [bacterium]|nr:hypothetical protein [bacterium]
MKSVRYALVFGAIVALAACSHKATVMTSEGPASVSQSDDGKSMTVTTKDGTVSIDKAVDASTLGAPVYPGATSAGSLSGTTEKGTGALATYTTKDSFDKVYAFYKSKLPAGSEKMKMATGDSQMAVFQVGADSAPEQTSVTVNAENGETTIQIAHGTKTQGN